MESIYSITCVFICVALVMSSSIERGELEREDRSCSCDHSYQYPVHMEASYCQPNPCHHGYCLSNNQGFMCICEEGFTGFLCEDAEQNPCSENPCTNGGECIPCHHDSFVCDCPFPWFGYTCGASDLCAGVNCNTGTCNPATGMCQCLCGYTGTFCDMPSNSPCSSFTCYNGGTCQEVASVAECDCPPHFFGDQCQYSCGGDGYIYFDLMCYKLIEEPPAAFNGANAHCRQDGANLAEPREEKVHDFLVTTFLNSADTALVYWVGAQTNNAGTTNSYTWRSDMAQVGTPDQWGSGEPSVTQGGGPDCIAYELRSGSWIWASYRCSGNGKGRICQKSADDTSTLAVL